MLAASKMAKFDRLGWNSKSDEDGQSRRRFNRGANAPRSPKMPEDGQQHATSKFKPASPPGTALAKMPPIFGGEKESESDVSVWANKCSDLADEQSRLPGAHCAPSLGGAQKNGPGGQNRGQAAIREERLAMA